MKKTKYGTSDSMSRALKNLEQAKARYDAEKRKANEKRRKGAEPPQIPDGRHCRKDSMYPRPARLSFVRLRRTKLRSPSIPGGSPLKARYARASDGQGYFQHNSATER